jgi:hypothetical protein
MKAGAMLLVERHLEPGKRFEQTSRSCGLPEYHTIALYQW